MNKLTKQVCFTALFTAGVALSTSAAAFPSFDVDESVVPSSTGGTLTSDRITGDYREVVTFGAGTFDVSILWTAGQYVGATSQLNCGIAPNCYNMYGLFQGAGTWAPSGAQTVFTFSSGSFDLIMDPGQNSNYLAGAPATGLLPWTATGPTIDDLLVGSGTLISGTGLLDPTLSTCGPNKGINCGSFGTSTTFSLTPFGKTYFVDPSPFYSLTFESGQFNIIQVVAGTTVTTNGSLDVIFGRVPEPGILALFGLGLLGLAGVARRKV